MDKESMRNRLIIAFMLVAGIAHGQDSLRYINIGGAATESGAALYQHSDSTFIFLLNTGAVAQSNADIDVLELNDSGGILNAYRFGTLGTDQLIASDKLAGRLALAGTSNGNGNGYEGFLQVVEMPSEVIFQYFTSVYGQWSRLTAVSFLNADTLIVSVESAMDESAPIVLKRISLAAQGSVQESVMSEFPGHHILAFYRGLDGGLLACGYRGQQDRDAFLCGINSALEVGWIAYFETTLDEELVQLAQLSDGSIVATGYSAGFNEEDEDILVLKTGPLGNHLDTLILGYNNTVDNKNDRSTNVYVKNDTIYLTGWTETFGGGGQECFMTRLSSGLTSMFGSTTFGTTKNEVSIAIFPYRQGVVGAGSTEFQAAGQKDGLFWRRDQFLFESVGMFLQVHPYSVSETILAVEEPDFLREGRVPLLDEMADESYLWGVDGRFYGSVSQHYQFGAWLNDLPSGVYIIEQRTASEQLYFKIFIH
jgi:hypothetical protein